MRKNLEEKANQLNETDFKQIIGVKKQTFKRMIEVLTAAYIQKHQKRGRHTKLSIEEQLFMSLKYWRQYITQKELAFEFEIGEATVHDTIVWVENTLIQSGEFKLLGKKALLKQKENNIEIIVVDVTESPIERPKKNKKNGIQGKRKNIQ